MTVILWASLGIFKECMEGSIACHLGKEENNNHQMMSDIDWSNES